MVYDAAYEGNTHAGHTRWLGTDQSPSGPVLGARNESEDSILLHNSTNLASTHNKNNNPALQCSLQPLQLLERIPDPGI